MKKLLLLAALAAGPAWGATYFVKPSATGTGDCSTAANACTLATCVALINGASGASGDTCSMENGTYTAGSTITASRNCGTNTSVCTIKATTPGTATDSSSMGVILLVSSGSGDVFLFSGQNWVMDGIYAQISTQRIYTHVTASTGFTWKRNRVEVAPGFGGSEILWTNGTSDIRVQNNWTHTFPGCQNGASSPGGVGGDAASGCGGTLNNCGTHCRCDFDTRSGSMYLFVGDGAVTADTNLIFEGNDYGHWQNSIRLRNWGGRGADGTWSAIFRKSICTNATNHACVELNDTEHVLFENFIADIDTSTSDCHDELLQSSIYDTGCAWDIVIRNSTSVGHNIGWEQQAQSLLSTCADTRCNDTANALPEICDTAINPGRSPYEKLETYNTIIYDGKHGSGTTYLGGSGNPNGAGATALFVRTAESSGYNQAASAGPGYYIDYNIIARPPGDIVAIDGSTTYASMAAWRLHDLDTGPGTYFPDTHSLTTDPQFVGYGNVTGASNQHNYRPASSAAPQVNAGVNTTNQPCAVEDYDGNPRGGANGACDIGAFEFQAGGGSVCGNNTKESGEVCDGTDLAGETCATQVPGTVGTLACASDCLSFVTRGCTVSTDQSAKAQGVKITGGSVQ